MALNQAELNVLNIIQRRCSGKAAIYDDIVSECCRKNIITRKHLDSVLNSLISKGMISPSCGISTYLSRVWGCYITPRAYAILSELPAGPIPLMEYIEGNGGLNENLILLLENVNLSPEDESVLLNKFLYMLRDTSLNSKSNAVFSSMCQQVIRYTKQIDDISFLFKCALPPEVSSTRSELIVKALRRRLAECKSLQEEGLLSLTLLSLTRLTLQLGCLVPDDMHLHPEKWNLFVNAYICLCLLGRPPVKKVTLSNSCLREKLYNKLSQIYNNWISKKTEVAESIKNIVLGEIIKLEAYQKTIVHTFVTNPEDCPEDQITVETRFSLTPQGYYKTAQSVNDPVAGWSSDLSASPDRLRKLADELEIVADNVENPEIEKISGIDVRVKNIVPRLD